MKTLGALSVMILLSMVSVSAQDMHGNTTGNEDVLGETLLKQPSQRHQWADFLRFQADERRVFFDDLSQELKKAKNEWDEKHRELLLEQREARHKFEPEQHTIDERRDFYVTQRDRMAKFQSEKKKALGALSADHQKRRDNFRKRQAQDRKDFRTKLKLPADEE